MVIIAYEMAYKISNTWVQLAFSGVVVAGICRFHSSLQQVIWIQLLLMLVLLIVVASPFLGHWLKGAARLQSAAGSPGIRLLRPVSEDEVIAEFLRSDFNSPVFEPYQESMRHLVTHPRLEHAGDNAKRRALFYIRHLSLWRELPRGTQWYEVEVGAENLAQIRVFPRALWRKFARGNFAFPVVAERLRTFRGHNIAEKTFVAKLASMREQLRQNSDGDPGAVLLIGLNPSEPLTILDGNHRLMAAALSSPQTLQKLRFFCGLSPRMTTCCWYKDQRLHPVPLRRQPVDPRGARSEADLERLFTRFLKA